MGAKANPFLRVRNIVDSATYDIDDELKAARLLDEYLGDQWDVSKNEDKYAVDLVVRHDGDVCGYVEIEHAERWKHGDLPDNWVYISSLKRKVYQYKRYTHEARQEHDTKGVFTDEPLEKAPDTVFLKFSHDMSNCFAVPTMAFYEDGYSTTLSRENGYNNDYVAIDFDNDAFHMGMAESFRFIEAFMFARRF